MRWNQVLTVVGCHAEGEIGNVVTGGVGNVPGATMLEKKQFLERERDDLRQMLLREPRGGARNIRTPRRHGCPRRDRHR